MDDDLNDDCDDDSPADNALRVEVVDDRSCVRTLAGKCNSVYNIETEFQEFYLFRIPIKVHHMIICMNLSVRRRGNWRPRAACNEERWSGGGATP